MFEMFRSKPLGLIDDLWICHAHKGTFGNSEESSMIEDSSCTSILSILMHIGVEIGIGVYIFSVEDSSGP